MRAPIRRTRQTSRKRAQPIRETNILEEDEDEIEENVVEDEEDDSNDLILFSRMTRSSPSQVRIQKYIMNLKNNGLLQPDDNFDVATKSQ